MSWLIFQIAVVVLNANFFLKEGVSAFSLDHLGLLDLAEVLLHFRLVVCGRVLRFDVQLPFELLSHCYFHCCLVKGQKEPGDGEILTSLLCT